MCLWLQMSHLVKTLKYYMLFGPHWHLETVWLESKEVLKSWWSAKHVIVDEGWKIFYNFVNCTFNTMTWKFHVIVKSSARQQNVYALLKCFPSRLLPLSATTWGPCWNSCPWMSLQAYNHIMKTDDNKNKTITSSWQQFQQSLTEVIPKKCLSWTNGQSK